MTTKDPYRTKAEVEEPMKKLRIRISPMWFIPLWLALFGAAITHDGCSGIGIREQPTLSQRERDVRWALVIFSLGMAALCLFKGMVHEAKRFDDE